MKSMDADIEMGSDVGVELLTDEEQTIEEGELDVTAAGEDEAASEQQQSSAEQPPIPEGLASRIEAVLLSLDRPATSAKIADWLEVGLSEGGAGTIGRAIGQLNDIYKETGRSFRIERVAGGWQIRTLGDFAEDIAKVRQRRTESKLSQPALETLAIVAYRQPILRADVEAIRGVACGEVLRTLMERRLVKIVGRAEELGRPMLYGTTSKFLEVFGLSSLKDLPKNSELRPG